MITLIAVSNPFQPAISREAHQVEWHEGISLAEVLEAAGVPTLRHACVIDGLAIPEEILAGYIVADGATVISMPCVGGGGFGKMFAEIAILVASAAVTAGLAAGVEATIFGLTMAVQMGTGLASIVGGSIAIGGNMLVNAFMGGGGPGGADSASLNPTGPKTVASGGVSIPKGYGTYLSGGNIIASYVAAEGTDNYVNVLVSYGWGPAVAITDVTINNNSISNYTATTYMTRLGSNTQTAMPNFNNIVNGYPQEIRAVALAGTIDTGANPGTPVIIQGTGTKTQGLQVVMQFPDGIYFANTDGSIRSFSVAYQVQYSISGENNWQNPVIPNPATCTDLITYNPNGTVLSAPGWVVVPTDGNYSSGLVYAYDDTYSSTAYTPGQPWSETQTVTYYNADGSSYRGSITLNGEWQVCDPTLNQQVVNGWMAGYVIFTDSNQGALYHTTNIFNLPPNKYDVCVTKFGGAFGGDPIIARECNSDVTGDQTWVYSINEIEYQDLAYPNMILNGVRALATDQISGANIQVGAIVQYGITATLPAALAGFGLDNPAIVVYDMLCAAYYGGNIPASQIDVPSFVVWANYNDELVSDGFEGTIKRHVFNGVFDAMGTNLWKSVQKVAMMAQASIVSIGMNYTVVVDMPVTVPAQVFTSSNVLKDSIKDTWLSFDDRANRIEVTFADAARNYRTDEPCAVMLPQDIAAGVEVKTTRVQLLGCTSRAQAWHWAYRKLMSTDLLLLTRSFDVGIEAVACQVGSVIGVQDDITQWCNGGRIQAGSTATSLIVDWANLAFIAGEGWTVSVVHPVVVRGTGVIYSIVGNVITFVAALPAGNIVSLENAVGNVGVVQAAGTSSVTVKSAYGLAGGQSVTFYDQDVVDTQPVSALVGNVLTPLAPFMQTPSPDAPWVYGQSAGAFPAQLFTVTNIRKKNDLQVTIDTLQYLAAIYSDDTPIITETLGTPDINAAVTSLTAIEVYTVSDSATGGMASQISVGWQNGPATAQVEIWVATNDPNQPLSAETLVQTVSKGATCTLVYPTGAFVQIRAVGVDSNGGTAPYTTAPIVTITVEGTRIVSPTQVAVDANAETVATALANAAAAQTAANNANALLVILSTETVLTPGQKPSLMADVSALNAAQSANDSQAAAVGVSHAAYDTALSTLNAYLATLTSPVAWNVTTNYTTITGVTLSSDLQAAYSAQYVLMCAIDAAINSTATMAVESAATAIANAAAAQAAATAVTASLNTLSTTSQLLPGTKAAIIADYGVLISNQTLYDAQAAAVGVSRIAYDAAISALTAYLATLTSPVAWNNVSGITNIVGYTFASTFEAAYSAQSALLSAIAATINSTAIYATPAINLVPDSNLQFGIGPSAYWSNPGSEWSVVDAISTSNPDPASPVPGCMALMVSAAASGTYQCTQSTPFQLVAGQTYTLSGFIDTYYVTAGTPVWQLYNPSITTFYVTVTQAPGQTGRVSITFTFSPVGVAAGTAVNVVLLFDTNACTISSGGVLLAAAPMIQPGSTMTAYIAGVGATNSTAGLAHGAMSSSVQGIITASTSTTPAYLSASATVQGTTTTLAAITPIATLMPSQAGADVTAQQAIVYTGSSESIVPNGTFILDNTQGWVLSGATYSLGGGPGAWSDAILIYASNLGENFAATPVFSVVGGATYMITVTGFYGGVTVSPNPVMRVNYGSASTGLQGWASSSSYTTIYLPFAYNFENNYSFEWVCPGGLFASIQICSNGTTGGDIYLEGVTCVPYGATGQWGADVTSLNQSATTASLSNQSLDTLSNGSTYSRQLATTLANGLPVRSGKAAILYLAPTNFWPLDNNSMTDIGTGPVNLSLFIGSGGSSGIAVQSPAPGDAIAGSYVYGQAAWYASLWSPTSWTVMTWVYFGGNLPPQGGVAGIFANANASPDGYAPTGYNPVMFVDSSGYVHAGTYGNGLNEAVSASAPNWSVPHHLACTYNYNTLTLFVDGLVVGTGSAPNSGALSIWIVGSVFGTSWPNLASGWNYCSNGINMQDVALWLGTCLSNSQVGNIFASYGNPNAASLGGVAAAAITPIASLVTSGSSSSLNKQGGLTGFGNLAFTYTGTYNTITVSWVTFDLYRSDGSITVISAGSYEFTGLATGTTYDIGCSLNVASSTLGEWMISATTSAATATTFSNLTIVTVLGLDGNIALLTGGPGMQASTAAVGSGGTSSGGSAGVRKGCPALEMFVYDGVQVGDLVIGDVLDCTDGEFPVEHDGVSLQPCVRVWTDVGHELIVSISTPFTLEDGSSCLAVAMDGSMVLTDSGHGTECVWARCHVEPAGARLVNFISVGGRTFAAGTTADRRIYSHNSQKI